jgi:hypothetical protein
MSARMRTTVAGGAVIMLLGGTSAVPAQADTVATITSGASA